MAEANYEPRLKTLYRSKIRESLTKEFSYTNPMQIPQLEKVVINMGVGEDHHRDLLWIKSKFAVQEIGFLSESLEHSAIKKDLLAVL